MDILEKHKNAKKKPIVFYHRFLNAYKKYNKDIFIFCEGEVDLGYYGEIIDHKYPSINIVKCVAECKNNVISIYQQIDWDNYEKNRVLFFVDRDLSYWSGETQYYDTNVYITEGYSFENDAVNEHMFIKCLQDLYGFANCEKNEIDALRIIYNNYWNDFVGGSYELMAYLLYKYKSSKEHKASNVKIKNCISFEESVFWRSEINGKGSRDYYEEKLEILNPVNDEEIDKIINTFIAKKDFYSIRGKWCLDFMIQLMEYVISNGEKYAPSLYRDEKKKPKRLVNLSERGAMAVLGPKIVPAKSLCDFLEKNIGERVNE